IALLAEPMPSGLARRLADDPALEDVTELARQTALRLAEMDLVQPERDPLRYQPNLLAQGLFAVHSALGGTAPSFLTRLQGAVAAQHRGLWEEHVSRLNGELYDRATATYSRLVLEALLEQTEVTDPKVAAALVERKKIRAQRPDLTSSHRGGQPHHHNVAEAIPAPDPVPGLDALQADLTAQFAGWVLLWPKEPADLTGFGGELDRVMQMPGWTNVWTMPIQNRVDMLSTGVNTTIGVRVLGQRLDDVVRASEDVAAVLRHVRGAVDVVADPVRGKGYLDVRV